MLDKLIKYSVEFAVPISQANQHQKQFESILHKLVNTTPSMKKTEIVRIKKLKD